VNSSLSHSLIHEWLLFDAGTWSCVVITVISHVCDK